MTFLLETDAKVLSVHNTVHNMKCTGLVFACLYLSLAASRVCFVLIFVGWSQFGSFHGDVAWTGLPVFACGVVRACAICAHVRVSLAPFVHCALGSLYC